MFTGGRRRRRPTAPPRRAASPIPVAFGHPVVETAIGGPLVHRAAAGDRRGQPALAGQQTRSRARSPRAASVQRGQEGLRVHQRTRPDTWPKPETGQQPGLERELAVQLQGVGATRSGRSRRVRRRHSPGCGSAGSPRRAGSGTDPIIWKTAAPPLACPVRLFCETMNSGAPAERPSESASRSCSSVSLGSLASVEVSCLEITATSSAPTPSLAAPAPAGNPCRRGRRPARPVPGPGSRCAHRRRRTARRPTTASTGRPIFSARSPRASRMVPPPCASRNPSRRRSLARENFESRCPAAHHLGVGGGRHVTEADDGLQRQVVEPPATTSSALPSRILSTPSSTETAAVAHAPTGWIIEP